MTPSLFLRCFIIGASIGFGVTLANHFVFDLGPVASLAVIVVVGFVVGVLTPAFKGPPWT